MTSVFDDLRFAARSLRREPAFVAGVVLTFALAIGANAAMFGLVQRLMLAPPPGVRGADSVVRLGLTFAAEEGSSHTVTTTSYPVFRAVAGVEDAFHGVATVRTGSAVVGSGAELAEAAVVQASGRFFEVLGVRPALGRLFGPEDDALPAGNDVAVLGHGYWRRVYGGDPGVLGRQFVVDGQPLTIIGVAPRGFHGVELSAADLFVPLSTAMRGRPAGWWEETGLRVGSVIARLKDGVTAAAASQRVASALRDEALGLTRAHLVATPLEALAPGLAGRTSAQGRVALWLSAVALVVLLIATANVGTLLLLRAARRRRDGAVRLALGASPARLLRQALVESVALALTGAVLGLLVASWLEDLVRVTLLPQLAPGEGFVDPAVLTASLALACGAGLLAGLSPIGQLRRRSLTLDLHSGGSGGGHGSTGRFLAQRLLVALQVGLSLLLLVGAALFVRSLRRVQSQDLGFSTARLLHVELDFRGRLRGAERDRAHEEAVRRVVTVPGVTAATVAQGMPFSSHHIPPISVPGHTFADPAVHQLPILYGATPQYLAMMDVRLREGRLFTETDGRGAPLVVLVNETMARTVWPGRSALGQCVRAGHGGPPFDQDPEVAVASLPCREVVGVVRDSRARSLRTEGSEDRLMQYYVPFAQLPPVPAPDASSVHSLLIQTDGDPGRLVEPVRRLLQATSPVPVYARVQPYQELLDPQLRSWRLGASLFTAFGGLALGIAALGLFAVVSYLVAQRSQEIGVRLALGGTGARVARFVVGDALRMAAAGAAAGVLLALAAAPLLQPMLFQTSARDAASLLSAGGLLLLVTLAAAALPAWRASRVSPMAVLRA